MAEGGLRQGRRPSRHRPDGGGQRIGVVLLPAPTPEQLRALRTEMGWSARQAGEAFWYPDAGPSWRRVEARGMEPIRWTLGLLALGRHPTQRLAPRE